MSAVVAGAWRRQRAVREYPSVAAMEKPSNMELDPTNGHGSVGPFAGQFQGALK
jgi:hypothetical protein